MQHTAGKRCRNSLSGTIETFFTTTHAGVIASEHQRLAEQVAEGGR